MSDFLESLRVRLEEFQARGKDITARYQSALARQQAAVQEVQALQPEYTIVTQELQGWARAYESENRREAALAAQAALATQASRELDQQASHESVETKTSPFTAELEQPTDSGNSELSKTQLIRDTLRDNPGGLRPSEIYRALSGEIKRKQYVYAVLGRLKERDQVSVRRGKYFLRETPKATVAGEDRQISIQ